MDDSTNIFICKGGVILTEPIDSLKFFIAEIVKFMNIRLYWGSFSFTLWEGFVISVVSAVLGYVVGKLLSNSNDD